MKHIYLTALICAGIMTCTYADAASLGTCSNNGLVCMMYNDCPIGGYCIIAGGGDGGNITCTNSSQCYDGYYCKITSGSVGKCTPYPDCSSGCTNCDTTAWTASGTGYQKQTVATCNTTFCECTKTTQYRCAAGYYGSSTNGTSGCKRCPSSDGVSGSANAGSTVITSCYLPTGTNFSNATGNGTYTSNCYYSN